ncbi:MAG: TM2 domain-containing protein [Allosphingosinicella sp.]
MKGQVLTYDQLTAEGVISGENGERYSFSGIEWKSAPHQLRTGAGVDFAAEASLARAIYIVPANPAAPARYDGTEKSPIAAGLLALFLGGLGIHKFYLGYTSEGVILLVATFLSWVTLIIGIGLIGLFAIGVICLVEAIIYLTKSPEEFQSIYVDGRKPWF